MKRVLFCVSILVMSASALAQDAIYDCNTLKHGTVEGPIVGMKYSIEVKDGKVSVISVSEKETVSRTLFLMETVDKVRKYGAGNFTASLPLAEGAQVTLSRSLGLKEFEGDCYKR